MMASHWKQQCQSKDLFHCESSETGDVWQEFNSSFHNHGSGENGSLQDEFD